MAGFFDLICLDIFLTIFESNEFAKKKKKISLFEQYIPFVLNNIGSLSVSLSLHSPLSAKCFHLAQISRCLKPTVHCLTVLTRLDGLGAI